MNKHINLVKDHFNTKYDGYDVRIRKLIPNYEEMCQIVTDAINFPRNKKINVLDLGIGTGQTALEILKKFPNSKIDGVDIAISMLKEGQRILKDFSNRVNLIEKNMINFIPRKKYDACVAILSIHHLNKEQKQILFKKIFRLLNNDGVFIIGDLVDNKKQESVWKKYLINKLGKTEGSYWFQNYLEEDLPDSIENQLFWLKKSGFNETKKLWEHMNYAVLFAKK